MSLLLDVNVMVALLDPGHVFHDVAHAWFAGRDSSWATCPLTENGAIRVISHPRYPNSTGTAASAAQLVTQLCDVEGHVFWPDSVSLRDPEVCRIERLTTSGQVTDSYLLALAVAKRGRLVTFDRRIVTSAIPGGSDALLVLGANR